MDAFLLDLFFPVIVPIAMGVFALLLRSQLASIAVEQNYWLLGVRFNRRYYEFGFVVGGLGMITAGVLTLLGVIVY